MKTALARFDLSLNLRYNALVIRAFATVWLVISLAVILNSATVFGQTTEADVYVAQAVLDLDEKRYDAALENLRRALELEPDHVEALYFTGAVYAAQKRPDLAAPYRERARTKSPRDPSIAYQLGLVYFAQQQYEKAQPLLEEAFKANPDLDSLGYYVGFLRYRNKDYRGALAALRQGRSSDPEIQQLTRFYTGLALGVLGLPGQAAAEVEQAIRLAPGSQLTGPAERLRDTVSRSVVVIESARNFTQGFVRFQAKDFADVDRTQRIINDNRSGNNYMAGFLHFVRFAEDRHYLKVGYQFDWDDTGNDDGRNWMYYGNRLSFGGQYTLPWWAIRLKYDLDAHLRDYTHKNTVLPTYAPGTK